MLLAGRAAVLIAVNRPLSLQSAILYTTNLYPVPPNLNLSMAMVDFSSHYGAQATAELQQSGGFYLAEAVETAQAL